MPKSLHLGEPDWFAARDEWAKRSWSLSGGQGSSIRRYREMGMTYWLEKAEAEMRTRD
jgi:hypothetical protein